MQICVVGTEQCRDNSTEHEDGLAVFFVVGLRSIGKGFLDVLEAAVFPTKGQIHRRIESLTGMPERQTAN
jgi:hypothetical protein